jgi:hypothetical protein
MSPTQAPKEVEHLRTQYEEAYRTQEYGKQ